MRIITAAAIKGGSGKTTTCAALAQAAAKHNKKVLAIDLDPQANLSYALAADQNLPGSYQLITGADPATAIQSTEQCIDVVAGSPDLAALKTKPGSAKRLQAALQAIKQQYDLIIIDTPPTLGECQYNALQAANGLIIPLEVDAYSLQGLYQITDIAKQIQKTNPDLQILGTILTRYDNRPNLNRYLRDVIKDKGAESGAPLLGEIRAGIAIREAAAMQQSLYEYAPKSKPAQDYLQIYQQII